MNNNQFQTTGATGNGDRKRLRSNSVGPYAKGAYVPNVNGPNVNGPNEQNANKSKTEMSPLKKIIKDLEKSIESISNPAQHAATNTFSIIGPIQLENKDMNNAIKYLVKLYTDKTSEIEPTIPYVTDLTTQVENKFKLENLSYENIIKKAIEILKILDDKNVPDTDELKHISDIIELLQTSININNIKIALKESNQPTGGKRKTRKTIKVRKAKKAKTAKKAKKSLKRRRN
jgi:hypothetical protein